MNGVTALPSESTPVMPQMMPSPMTDLIARGSMPLEDISSVHSRIPWIVSRRYSSGSISTQRGSG